MELLCEDQVVRIVQLVGLMRCVTSRVPNPVTSTARWQRRRHGVYVGEELLDGTGDVGRITVSVSGDIAAAACLEGVTGYFKHRENETERGSWDGGIADFNDG